MIAQTTLASWDVADVNAAALGGSMNGLLTASLASATLTIGPGASPSVAKSTFGGNDFDQSSLAAAIASGDYIGFTLTAAPGYTLQISKVSILLGKTSSSEVIMETHLFSRTGASGESNWIDTYSFDELSADRRIFDIPASSVQSVEFRLYGFSGATTDTLRIRSLSGSDLIVSGTVTAVPEPSSYAIVLAAATFVGALARRRARREKSHP